MSEIGSFTLRIGVKIKNIGNHPMHIYLCLYLPGKRVPLMDPLQGVNSSSLRVLNGTPDWKVHGVNISYMMEHDELNKL